MDFYFVVAGVVTLTLVILTCASWIASYTGAQDEAAARYTIVTPTPNTDSQGAAQPTVDSSVLNSGHVINRECPADGRPLGYHIPSKAADIDAAVERAAIAQRTWSPTFSQRRRLLKTLLRHILDNQESIVAACCIDSGKTKIDACFGEILVTVEKLQWTIKHGERALA